MEEIKEKKDVDIQKIIFSIKKKDAIIYCRVSSIGQTGGFHVSFEVQESKGKICADLFKLKVFSIIKVVESAYQGNTCTIKSLISKNRGKNIIIYNVSRFSRNKNHGIDLLNHALKYNVRLFFVQEGVVWDRENQENFKFLKKKLKYAEQESKELGKRIKDALELKKKNGFFTGGKPKYGYDTVSFPEGKKLGLNENEQEVIKFINMCKTVGTSVNSLNKQMKKITRDFDKPISITYYGFGDIQNLREPLTNNNIAELLNGYSVLRREGNWTGNSVGAITRRDYNDIVEKVQVVNLISNNNTGFSF